MTTLFDIGQKRHPSFAEIVRVRNWGRKHLSKSEDRWGASELVKVRAQLGSEWEWYDLFELKNRCILSRKDKLETVTKNLRAFMKRLSTAANAWTKEKKRRPVRHSAEYLRRIDSDDWRQFVAQHSNSCSLRCQLCGSSSALDGHHTPEGYLHLGTEDTVHVLCLCRRCHNIADLIREVGKLERADERRNGLKFTCDELQDIFGIDLETDE